MGAMHKIWKVVGFFSSLSRYAIQVSSYNFLILLIMAGLTSSTRQ